MSIRRKVRAPRGTPAGGVAIFAGALLLCTASRAAALNVPFTEHFSANASSWFDASGAVPLTWQAAGGPDGSGYASGSFQFAGSSAGDGPAVLRAHDEYGSSGGAFVGNWVASGVTAFQAYVRQDTGVDLNYFVRFSGPGNFPGGIGSVTTPVPSGVWTQISLPIGPASPFNYEGPSSYNSVFGNLGHIQIGIEVPASLAGIAQSSTFDIDQVAIVPEPGTLLLAGGLVLPLARASRRRVLPAVVQGQVPERI